MLNSNPDVHLTAEPLSRLKKGSSAAEELEAIKMEIKSLENASVTTTGPDRRRVIGFNEKFLSKRYRLPSNPEYFEKFKRYLAEAKFR